MRVVVAYLDVKFESVRSLKIDVVALEVRRVVVHCASYQAAGRCDLKDPGGVVSGKRSFETAIL